MTAEYLILKDSAQVSNCGSSFLYLYVLLCCADIDKFLLHLAHWPKRCAAALIEVRS